MTDPPMSEVGTDEPIDQGPQPLRATEEKIAPPELTEIPNPDPAPVASDRLEVRDRPLQSVKYGDAPGHIAYEGLSECLKNFSDDVRRYLNEQRDMVNFPGATPLNDQERTDYAAMKDAYSRLGEKLGVDLESRVTDPRHIHVFDRQEDFDTTFGVTGVGGTVSPAQGIILVRDSRPGKTACTLWHEAGHDMSLVRIRPTLKSFLTDGYKISADVNIGYNLGYTHLLPNPDPKQFHGVTEWVTDMNMDRAWHTSGRNLPWHGYTPMNIIGGTVLKETAAANRVSPQELEDAVSRGMFTGELTGMNLIGEYLGEERMNTFLGLSARLNPQTAVQAARDLGLKTAEAELEFYAYWGYYRVFDWR
jgi:hypothetical protein